ncbi:MAG: acetate--CoA ligase family protein [Bacteroidales bacterium]|nr:acetate--CoA ligase family protein [Bacteroidales bacterium]MDD4529245.1 acetate--CoA ligase family protein [Bacteroidales bacterium]
MSTKVTKELVNPRSIVVVGASNDVTKPGGAILRNIIEGGFKGDIYVVNPKEDEIQGVKCYKDIKDVPQVDMAVLAIAAKFSEATVKVLTEEKSTKAFIIISAGFGEESQEGKELEQRIVKLIEDNDACLIGPNCTGIFTPHHRAIFSKPFPQTSSKGVDFITGSGATGCFIMDIGMQQGLHFNHCWGVGNSAQLGIEDILEYHDEAFDPKTSSKVILMYAENIKNPQKLLKHASSLINKGCRIAAIKSGGSEAGSRAASSHTGALASPDVAVDALFRKAGIIRCNGREELITVGAIFTYPEFEGKNIAIITHAGGPAVMLTDALSRGAMDVPHIEGPKADELLTKLFAGSAVGNPIDFLATGTPEQLGQIIDACNNDFDNIDAMCIIFGTPGLDKIFDAYRVIDQKMKTSKKPIFPIMPSTLVAGEEVREFVSKGNNYFPEETVFGTALAKIKSTPKPTNDVKDLISIDTKKVRQIIESVGDGYMDTKVMYDLLDAAGINHSNEISSNKVEDSIAFAKQFGYPLVMKVVGPVHKSDVGGVVLNVKDEETIRREFDRLMKIKDTYAVQTLQMLFGTEIYIGSMRTDLFGHQVLCGIGGIFIEVLKDVQSNLAPIGIGEAKQMIKNLRSYKIIEGVRGQEPVNEELYAEQIARVSALVQAAPEIAEMDLNPLLGSAKAVVAVDARIRIEK